MLTHSPHELIAPSHPTPPRRPWYLLAGAALAAAGFAAGWITHRPSTPPATTPLQADASIPFARATGPTTTTVRSVTAATSAARLAAALTAVRQPPGRAAKLYAFAQRLGELDPSQYPTLLQELRRAHFPDTAEMVAMLCSVWAGHDGPAAFAAARSLAATDSEFDALHAAISAWASHDPAAARRALESAQLAALTTDEMAAFMQGWASADPVAVEDFLRHAAPPSAGEGAEFPAAVERGYEAVAAARIRNDPAGALAWFKALDGSLRTRTQQAFLSQLAATRPQLAAEWLARDAAPSFGESDLLPVLRGLQLSGCDQQFAWARNVANSDTRDAALVAVVRDGAGTNLVSLGEWLAARSDDPTLNGAFAAYATRVVRKSPDAAINWASSLESADLRRRTLTAVASEWASYDFRAARAWAERTHLVDWEAIAH